MGLIRCYFVQDRVAGFCHQWRLDFWRRQRNCGSVDHGQTLMNRSTSVYGTPQRPSGCLA